MPHGPAGGRSTGCRNRFVLGADTTTGVPRVPTSVALTLAGIALTAWLLPAFTRQWDDRQKSRELKANLVAQMSAASVKPIVVVRRYYDPNTKAAFAARDAAMAAWLLESLQLEARLRTYFSERIVVAWDSYRQSVNGYFDLPSTSTGTGSQRLPRRHRAALPPTGPGCRAGRRIQKRRLRRFL